MTASRERPLPQRREFITVGVGALLVAAIPIARRDRRRVVRRTMPVMATLADFTVIHHDVAWAERAIDAAMDELRRVEELMTRFRTGSDVGRINGAGGTAPVAVSSDTRAVVESAVRWARASGGRFDPAIGRVVELWDVAHRHEPPGETAVRGLAGVHGWRRIETGTERGQAAVFVGQDNLHLDLGGIAAGYGVDLAIDALQRWGIRDALVNVSGDIRVLGNAADGSPWRVGIRSAGDRHALAGEVEVSDGAIATSGDYEQYFAYRGTRYHHIMDPDTAAPRRSARHSVTVTAATCLDADAGSTAVFGLERGEAERLLSAASPGARVVSVE